MPSGTSVRNGFSDTLWRILKAGLSLSGYHILHGYFLRIQGYLMCRLDKFTPRFLFIMSFLHHLNIFYS